MTDSSSMGVYFSANDKVYDWAIAFLNSYRTFNPDLRLILIPFNEECDRQTPSGRTKSLGYPI